MKKFFSTLNTKLNNRFVFPYEGRFALIVKSFSPRERKLFFGAFGVLALTTLILLAVINRSFEVPVPAHGGSLTEGVLNTPAHINPLLATAEIGSEADRDLSALIYSGLLRTDKEGNFIPDLAESYTLSTDGLEYTFTLKPNLVWHDGEKITADDVVFTVKTAQDNRMKSPKRASWDGVDVEKVDDLTVRFTLKKPYVPFLENTTMGILPKHIWESIDYNRFDTNKYNREPIGSGPYKLESIQTTTTKDGDTLPLSYTLTAFKHFALGEPYIDSIKVVFYHDEASLVSALTSGQVEAINSISPDNARILSEKGYHVEHAPLPRVLGVFFNQTEAPIFADSAVRQALALVVDRQPIIDKVLDGYATPIDSPIPPGSFGYAPMTTEKPITDRIETAKNILEKDGWSFSTTTNAWTKKVSKKETSTLSFSLATSEADELKGVAQELQTAWEAFGVQVDVHIFATGDLKESIVRPRKFDALFFGQILGRNGDPYPFWHSSQRIDPGLNIASYANKKVDSLLEDARTETDELQRATDYQKFNDLIAADTPAIFVYSPEFLYVVPQKIQGLALGSITIPAERFLSVYQWYINTDLVWKMFAH